MTEAHRCEQFAQGCYAALSRWEWNPLPIYRYPTPYRYTTLPSYHIQVGTWTIDKIPVDAAVFTLFTFNKMTLTSKMSTVIQVGI